MAVTSGPSISDVPSTPGWWERPSLWIAVAVLSSAPVIVAPIPMMPDLHSHIGRYYVMMHFAEPQIARYYSFHWELVANLGVDLVVWLLAHFAPVETAARIAVGLIPPLSVAGLYALSRATSGRISPWAFVSLSLIWSFPLLFGFVNFALGSALAFLLGATWISLRSKLRVQMAVGLPFGLIMWVCHMSAFGIWLIIILTYGLFEAARSPASEWVKRTLSLGLPCTPLLLSIMARSHARDVPTLGSWDLFLKPSRIGMLLRDGSMAFDIACAGMLVCAVAILSILAILRQHRAQTATLTAGLIVCGMVAVLPTEIMGSYYADIRLLPAGMMLVFLSFSGSAPRCGTTVVFAGLLLFAVRLSITTLDWRLRSASAETELGALSTVPQGSRIALFAPYGACAGWRFNNFDHLGSRAIPRKQVFINTEWDIPWGGLMRPIYNSDRGTNDNTSTKLTGLKWPKCSIGKSIENRMQELQRDRFDFVWVFDQGLDQASYPWLQSVFRGPHGQLFRITHNRSSA